MIRHHQIKARLLHPGHLMYTGGSGNYVLVATATPNSEGKIDIVIYNGDQVDPCVKYTLDPESDVSVSAMVPMPAWLHAQQWETVINTLTDEAEEQADIECASCDKAPPFCLDHQDDLRRAGSKADIATKLRAQIGQQAAGAAPAEHSADAAVRRTYTAVGIWRDREPVLVAVVPGDNDVAFGSLDDFDGFWVTRVEAADINAAHAASIADVTAHRDEMLAAAEV